MHAFTDFMLHAGRICSQYGLVPVAHEVSREQTCSKPMRESQVRRTSWQSAIRAPEGTFWRRITSPRIPRMTVSPRHPRGVLALGWLFVGVMSLVRGRNGPFRAGPCGFRAS
jgi:hypothetical protein